MLIQGIFWMIFPAGGFLCAAPPALEVSSLSSPTADALS